MQRGISLRRRSLSVRSHWILSNTYPVPHHLYKELAAALLTLAADPMRLPTHSASVAGASLSANDRYLHRCAMWWTAMIT